MDVTTGKKERVRTVIIDRPEARNAVNRQTADQLVETFLQFDRDDHAAVAVLWGTGGTFCAGADLKAVAKISEGEANRLDGNMTAPGPMGPSCLKLSKPVIAAISGLAEKIQPDGTWMITNSILPETGKGGEHPNALQHEGLFFSCADLCFNISRRDAPAEPAPARRRRHPPS